MSAWRFLFTAPREGAANMALDRALMDRAREKGEWILRVYGWRPPTLSLGRNQRAAGAWDLEAIAARGIGIVRRPTGGRAILHDREATYSVTAPAGDAGALAESCARINRILAQGLRALGAEVHVAPAAGRQPIPGLTPCFERPAPGELVAGGRKLVGSAQWRDAGALLQHGSIMIEGTQSLVATLLRDPLPLPPPPATLGELLGRVPPIEEVGVALFGAVRLLEDPAATPLDAREVREVETNAARIRPLFEDPGWTWRR
ncbi:MAG TPA: hypothetical protein VGD77_09650 [Gemmatimonadaceae bacterium]